VINEKEENKGDKNRNKKIAELVFLALENFPAGK